MIVVLKILKLNEDSITLEVPPELFETFKNEELKITLQDIVQ